MNQRNIGTIIMNITILAVLGIVAVALIAWKKQNVSSYQGLLDLINSSDSYKFQNDSFVVTGSQNRNDLVSSSYTGFNGRKS